MNIQTITNAKIEDNKIVGTGTLDSLMHTLNLHLEKQYKEKRITGTDYANAYIAGMQSAFAQAIQLEQIRMTKIPSTLK